MTTYRVPVADPLLAQREFWQDVEGFRFVSEDGPWLGHHAVTICTFEDDHVDPALEGLLVEPTLTEHREDGKVTVKVTGRQVLS